MLGSFKPMIHDDLGWKPFILTHTHTEKERDRERQRETRRERGKYVVMHTSASIREFHFMTVQSHFPAKCTN